MGSAFGFNGLLANARLPLNFPFWLAAILSGLLAGVVSVAIERFAFRPLRRRGSDPLLTVVSSLGVALVIVNVIQYLVGAENYTFPEILTGACLLRSTLAQRITLFPFVQCRLSSSWFRLSFWEF